MVSTPWPIQEQRAGVTLVIRYEKVVRVGVDDCGQCKAKKGMNGTDASGLEHFGYQVSSIPNLVLRRLIHSIDIVPNAS